ncbi:hypothetical protein GCM10020229_42360 [Kitasatospora albolonga]|uniref:hypothetical protein n=1 Tax=Kitasatospora albolonga TaxID=68173 RepID=UPI0031EBDA40
MEEQELRRTEAVAATEPVAARVAADAVQPAEPLQARLQPMQMAEPVQATARLEPMQMAEPVQSTARLEPMQMAEPTRVTEPLRATDRLTPLEPTHATDRLAPLEPMQAAEPLRARTAVEPMQAAEPLSRVSGEAAEPLRARVAAQPAEQVKRVAQSAAPSGGPDAGQGFNVDPEKYRAAAGPVLSASDQLTELTRGLTAYMSGMSARAPWGNDDSGEKFANGEKGYLTYSGKVLEGLGNLPAALKYIADGLKVMAESYDNAEEGLKTGLTSMEAELPETALFHPDLAMRDIAKGRPHHTGRP